MSCRLKHLKLAEDVKELSPRVKTLLKDHGSPGYDTYSSSEEDDSEDEDEPSSKEEAAAGEDSDGMSLDSV